MTEYKKLMNLIDFNEPNKTLIAQYKSIQPFIDIISDLDQLKMDTEDLKDLLKDCRDECEILDVMEMENIEQMTAKENLYNKLIKMLTSSDELDSVHEVSIEVLCGAGGQESMLFAEELLTTYMKYITKNNWEIQKEYCNKHDLGGVRSCKYLVSGQDVYSHLKYESGIHRVQRIPSTSSLGKIHTSTAAVIVLPYLEDIDLEIPDTELKWDYFKSSGPGGQHVNSTDSAVRVTHIPSGISVGCQAGRLQQDNKKEALKQLRGILVEKRVEEKLHEINSNRRIFIGSRARSDKIRTYNYQQDRITDHRIHQSWSNLLRIMQEGDFGEIFSSLREVDLLDQLENALNISEHVSMSNK